jgi:hypothetical protein
MWEKERKAHRVPAAEPVSGSWKNGGACAISGVTRDVSSRGTFFYCEVAPELAARSSSCWNCRRNSSARLLRMFSAAGVLCEWNPRMRASRWVLRWSLRASSGFRVREVRVIVPADR